MERIIIIDDKGIQKELANFIAANKAHIKLHSSMDELSLGKEPILKEIIRRYEEKHKIKIQSKDNVWFYKLSEILFLISYLDVSVIHLSDGNSHHINEKLEFLEMQLQDFPFLKTHPDYLVNFYHIVKIEEGANAQVTLSNNEKIPVTESNMNMIIEYFNKHMK